MSGNRLNASSVPLQTQGSHRRLQLLPLRGSENQKAEARHPRCVPKSAKEGWKAAEKGCLGGQTLAAQQDPKVGLALACWGRGGGLGLQ